jgi:hypothetical protein
MLGLPASGLRELRALIERRGLHAEPFAPVAARQLARDEGWHLRFAASMGALYGVGVVDGTTRLMVLNEAVSLEWQRFAIAHELAHYVLGHAGGVFTCLESELVRAERTREEIEANIGAAYLLIPDRALGLAEVADVAGLCGVPFDLVELRRACAIGVRDRPWSVLLERSA